MFKARSASLLQTGLLLAGLLLFNPLAAAQGIDPALLEQLRNRGGNGAETTPSALDQSRDANALRQDQERREAILRAREQEQTAAGGNGSPVERRISERLRGDVRLRQFGYDMFGFVDRAAPPMTGVAGDDYAMGVGDELVLVFQGSENTVLRAKVDREGRLVTTKFPPIAAAGRSLGAVRADIEARVRETLLGTEVFVSLGAVRTISVYVLGEVLLPGRYALTGLSDVLDALTTAGGVRKSGSLRSITVQHGDRSRVIDLYPVLIGGRLADISLTDGDRVVVPVLGDVFAVAGDVRRPGIYELPAKGSISAAEALTLAGGSLRHGVVGLVRGRYDADGREVYAEIAADRATIASADILLASERRRRAEGRVYFSGWVTAPGPRALSEATTLRQLLGGVDRLKRDAYLPFAALVTSDDGANSRQYQAVNLQEVLAGTADQPLKSEDELIVFGPDEIAFLSSPALRRVVLGEDNPVRACLALEHLSRLIKDTQSQRFSAVLRGIFLAESEQLEKVAAQLGDEKRKDAEREAVEGGDLQRSAQLQQLAAEKERADTEEARVLASCPSRFEDQPQLLQFTLEYVASLTGAVRKPGVFPIAGSLPADQLLAIAGGMSRDADHNLIEVMKFNRGGGDAPLIEQRSIDLDDVPLADVVISAGSGVQIRSKIDDQEAGGVLLSGEFERPGVYIIRRGEKLSAVIERAGGVNPQAYPYGAVFTRRSVKEAEQEGFRRTARELNSALIAASLRNNVDGEAVRAARDLAKDFATVEAPGRMVIEADPRVLRLKPNLDVVVEPGDTLFMPKHPNHVLVIGDVLNPGALQFVADKGVEDYLAEAGGMQISADKRRVFLVYPNGVAQPVRRSAWRRSDALLPPGSTVVVPKDTDPLRGLQLTRDIATIVSQFALSAASLAVILQN